MLTEDTREASPTLKSFWFSHSSPWPFSPSLILSPYQVFLFRHLLPGYFLLLSPWKRKSNLLLIKIKDGITTLEESLAVFYQTKYIFNTWSSNLTPWGLPEWVKNSCLYKNLFMVVYNSFIHNWKTWIQPRFSLLGK